MGGLSDRVPRATTRLPDRAPRPPATSPTTSPPPARSPPGPVRPRRSGPTAHLVGRRRRDAGIHDLDRQGRQGHGRRHRQEGRRPGDRRHDRPQAGQLAADDRLVRSARIQPATPRRRPVDADDADATAQIRQARSGSTTPQNQVSHGAQTRSTDLKARSSARDAQRPDRRHRHRGQHRQRASTPRRATRSSSTAPTSRSRPTSSRATSPTSRSARPRPVIDRRGRRDGRPATVAVDLPGRAERRSAAAASSRTRSPSPSRTRRPRVRSGMSADVTITIDERHRTS